jgi:spore coat protein CotH
VTTLAGDLDGNHVIDIYDYNQLIADYGRTGSPGFIPADIDANGVVNIYDYNILLTNFGQTQ